MCKVILGILKKESHLNRQQIWKVEANNIKLEKRNLVTMKGKRKSNFSVINIFAPNSIS